MGNVNAFEIKSRHMRAQGRGNNQSTAAGTSQARVGFAFRFGVVSTTRLQFKRAPKKYLVREPQNSPKKNNDIS